MARRLIVTLVFALASLIKVEAQGNSAGDQGADASQTLIELENTWVAALAKADLAKLDAVFADTYVDTDEDGNRTDKRGVISALESGDLKIASIVLSDMHVHLYGQSAIVTGTAAQSLAYKGHPAVPRIVFTDTFVLQDGRWRAVASHRSAVHGP
jgi:hypothetical protein